MLDNQTKQRIDSLRDILVGKVPDPKSQVEQITTGLIYKFMYDLDQESISLGGVGSFFVGEFEKYSWKKLFDPKLGGAKRVALYSEAVQSMYTNPTAPRLFRDIFKNSFLPFRDPRTLYMFLKELNEFNYSHSEKLGDAYEYLLSFMGSQGEAGQFRTPRHIIDFIVGIIDPKKNQTILDPACGTAGFLISAYKHILKSNTNKKEGDLLLAKERKQVAQNLHGYDISPDMTRISLVNMYLHRFASPNIHEYDTLSSDDRWREYYDIILANPPFFSPKGGIQPHSRFGVKSIRAEVLFVDYIMEHLKPNGRAGIIVPEGVIFQTGTAYKQLRKQLVETALVGVISLPAGVFQPYAGVKTSILILDKALNRKSDNIFFAKVKNDGFDLGAKRTPINKNDLPSLLASITAKDNDTDALAHISKSELLRQSNLSFSYSNYQKTKKYSSSYPVVKIDDVFTTSSGGTPKSGVDEYYQNGSIPWVRSGEVGGKFISDTEIKITQLGLENSSAKIFPKNSILVAMYGATVGKVGMLQIEASTNQAVCAIFPHESCLPKYLYYVLRSREQQLIDLSVGGAQPNISQTIIKNFEIPLPPIEVQQEIVDELERYQKIIDGCLQVVQNYKPTIDIDPSWNLVKFKDAPFDIIDGDRGKNYPSKEDFSDSDHCLFLNTKNVRSDGFEFSETMYITKEKDEQLRKGKLQIEDVLLTTRGTVGNTAYFGENVKYKNIRINSGMLIFRVNSGSLSPEYLFYFFQSQNCSDQFLHLISGSAQPQLPISSLRNALIPIPNIQQQRKVIEEIKNEKMIVGGNKKLIEIYTQKIQERISKIWGEEVSY